MGSVATHKTNFEQAEVPTDLWETTGAARKGSSRGNPMLLKLDEGKVRKFSGLIGFDPRMFALIFLAV